MRKILTTIAALAAFGLISLPALAGTLTVHLGESTSVYGIVFSGDTGTTGGLDVNIGACPLTGSASESCSGTGAVSGDISIGAATGTYSLSANDSVAEFASESSSGVDTWNITGPVSDSYTLSADGGKVTVTGAIDWTQIVENGSGVSLLGSASYTISGLLSGSGTKDISVLLAPLSCNDDVVGACTLANISGEKGDPPAAFSSVGSGTIGGSTTPEPGTLLLLGSGLLGLAPLIRRKFARP